MTENEFLLQDRIAKIKSINETHDLENNAYISFSGGKDSVVTSLLIDIALPKNNIPRVFIDTGIEYKEIREYIQWYTTVCKNVVILHPQKNIKDTLETYGYPFKSKQHSHNVAIYQNSGMTKTNINYLGQGTKENFLCPKKLHYQFTPDFNIKISDKCCYKLKKEVARRYEKESGKKICITGMRTGEGGYRNYQTNCVIFDGDNLKMFHPLKPCNNDFIEWILQQSKFPICKLYKEPYNFKRTGCKGCPFNKELNKELENLYLYSPSQAKSAYLIWKPIYEEYARINYRISPKLLKAIKEL